MPKSLLQRINRLYAVNQQKKKFTFSLPIGDKLKTGKGKSDVKIKTDEKLGTYIVWKNRKYPVEILFQKQNRYEVLLNGVSYHFTIETPTSMKRLTFLSRKKGKSDKEIIKAPMPGKIVEVLAQENTEVSKGEPLVILEAMKMQNEIQSPVNGKVVSINVKKNDTVMKDEVLVELKAQ